MGGGRAQIVWLLCLIDGEDAEWLVMNSPFAAASDVDVLAVLDQTQNYWTGGVVKIGNVLFLQQSVPLPAGDNDAWNRPLLAVLNVADILEEQFTAEDVF